MLARVCTCGHTSPRDKNNEAACLYPGRWGHMPGKEGQSKIKSICSLCSKRAAVFSENILLPCHLPFLLPLRCRVFTVSSEEGPAEQSRLCPLHTPGVGVATGTDLPSTSCHLPTSLGLVSDPRQLRVRWHRQACVKQYTLRGGIASEETTLTSHHRTRRPIFFSFLPCSVRGQNRQL